MDNFINECKARLIVERVPITAHASRNLPQTAIGALERRYSFWLRAFG
jgi:hypothetical protein